MFMTDKERAEAKLPRIYDIPLDRIDDFPDHPFKVRMDEDMDQLVQSIKGRGLITPITLRTKEDGRYEIVSGHRRKKACELAGLPTVKAEIREMSRDEAIILMVESNLQRSVILPSERAYSYKMRYEAMKRVAGTRTDLTGDPVGPRLKTSEMVALENSDSASQVKRYIRLTELVPDLLQMVDDGKIAMRPAVELSYLTKREQQWLVEAIGYADCTPSHAQAIRMRAFSKDGTLGPHVIENIMNEDKPNQVEKISLRYKDARRYIPDSVPYSQTGEYI
ncbi:MAG: ParB/RepB/Spo0J family partition protein, partial [Firmicutes bacterium]|nr:ParB/RepB/Spo0J family partition protein [Bacillota bacterium]